MPLQNPHFLGREQGINDFPFTEAACDQSGADLPSRLPCSQGNLLPAGALALIVLYGSKSPTLQL